MVLCVLFAGSAFSQGMPGGLGRDLNTGLADILAKKYHSQALLAPP